MKKAGIIRCRQTEDMCPPGDTDFTVTKEGLDSSSAMLKLAALRGISTYKGYAEGLAFDENAFL